MKHVLKVLPTHSRHDPAEFSNQQSENIVLLRGQFITTFTFIHSTPFTSVLINVNMMFNCISSRRINHHGAQLHAFILCLLAQNSLSFLEQFILSATTLGSTRWEDFNHPGRVPGGQGTRTNAKLHVRQFCGNQALRCHNPRRTCERPDTSINVCIKRGVPELRLIRTGT